MTDSIFWDDLRSGKFARMVKDEARGQQLNSSREVYNVMKPLFAESDDVETIYSVFLDARNRIICIEKLFSGTLSHSVVYPRELIKRVIALKGAAVILAHNHPSGCTEPSVDDLRITRVLTIALLSIDVQLHDHLVIGDGYHSMADHGLIKRIKDEFTRLWLV